MINKQLNSSTIQQLNNMKKIFSIMCTVLLIAGFSGCTKDNPDPTDDLVVIDFENVRVADLAGPTAYGENLYSDYTGSSPARYVGYTDEATGLRMKINETGDYFDVPTFYNGGIAISRWNDKETAGYLNQCSVYYGVHSAGNGGYQNSPTFAVGYGNSSISFQDNDKEGVLDHFYVTNSTYAALSMQNGDDFGAKVFSYADKDWFKLVIEGFNKSGTATGTLEFYLADFRTSTSPGIITEWTKVDLSPLGSVATIKFDLQSTDNGEWGMNTPAYFCFDNLAVILPE
jgi:hypothetical protein